MFKSGAELFGNKFPQIIAVLIATINAVSDGMSYGWPSPLIPSLQREDSPVPITDSDAVWLETMYLIAAFCGVPISILTVDRFGRKWTLIAVSSINFFHWVILACASNTTMLFVARCMCGICGGVTFVACPMFIAEIADQKIRGLLSSCIYIMMLLGIIVIYCIGPFVSLTVSSCIGSVFVLLQIIGLPFVPETPYYLIQKGHMEKAKKSLQFYRNSTNVEEELNEIASSLQTQIQNKTKITDLVTVKSNRKACTIMVTLNLAQHFSSISVMLMNLHTILEDAKGILSPETSAIIFSILMFIASTSASTIMDRFGRRIILIWSAIFTGFSLTLLAAYFSVKKQGFDVTEYNWVPVLAVMAYAVAFKFGMGIVPIVLTAELFANNVKAMGMTAANCTYVVAGTISIYVYQGMMSSYGIDAPMFLFAGCCFLTAVFAKIYIPETKGKTLSEIQAMLNGQNHVPIKSIVNNGVNHLDC